MTLEALGTVSREVTKKKRLKHACRVSAKIHPNKKSSEKPTLAGPLKVFAPSDGKKVKSAYGPMWPTRPELIPVSVA